MPIEKKKISKEKIINERTETTSNTESNNKNWFEQLKWWVIAIGIVLVIFILFTFAKFNALSNWSYIQMLESRITELESKWDWKVYEVIYGWWSDISNNLSWIWEKSLGFPDYLKWKNCYILWSKISWDDGWTIRWFLWKNDNWTSYQFATNYQARINNSEEKIEITKWNGSSSMLTKSERDNLYFSLTLLCR